MPELPKIWTNSYDKARLFEGFGIAIFSAGLVTYILGDTDNGKVFGLLTLGAITIITSSCWYANGDRTRLKHETLIHQAKKK